MSWMSEMIHDESRVNCSFSALDARLWHHSHSQNAALKDCALKSCLRHKQSTFSLIFSTSFLSRIYYKNSSWKNLAFNLSQTLILIDSFFLRQNQTMIRKLSAAELHRIVENNEFVTNAHRDENEVQQIRDSFTKRYLRNQNKSLKLWKASVNHVNNVH